MQIPEREKFAVCDSVVYHKMWYYVIDYIGHHGCMSAAVIHNGPRVPGIVDPLVFSNSWYEFSQSSWYGH